MGSFANSLHVQSEDSTAVAEAIRRVLRDEGYEVTDEELPNYGRGSLDSSLRGLHVSRPQRGWVSVLDSDIMHTFSLAERLSKELQTHVLQILVNDSDSWHYQLYQAGRTLDEFASSGDEDGDEEFEGGDEDEWDEAPDVAGRVPAADAQRLIMERAVQWQKHLEERLTPEMRELQEKWKKSGRVTAEEMRQYQEWMRQEMTPLMGDLRSMLGELSSARSAAAFRPRPVDDKLQGHVEHLKPLLQKGISDERVLGVMRKQDVFAEETLAEFLPLLGIASLYASLSYSYLDEHVAESLANESIELAEHLRFRQTTAPGAGRRRVVR